MKRLIVCLFVLVVGSINAIEIFSYKPDSYPFDGTVIYIRAVGRSSEASLKQASEQMEDRFRSIEHTYHWHTTNRIVGRVLDDVIEQFYDIEIGDLYQYYFHNEEYDIHYWGLILIKSLSLNGDYNYDYVSYYTYE